MTGGLADEDTRVGDVHNVHLTSHHCPSPSLTFTVNKIKLLTENTLGTNNKEISVTLSLVVHMLTVVLSVLEMKPLLQGQVSPGTGPSSQKVNDSDRFTTHNTQRTDFDRELIFDMQFNWILKYYSRI